MPPLKRLKIKKPDGTWIFITDLAIEIEIPYDTLAGRIKRYRAKHNKTIPWDLLTAPPSPRHVVNATGPHKTKQKTTRGKKQVRAEQVVIPKREARQPVKDWSKADEMRERLRKVAGI